MKCYIGGEALQISRPTKKTNKWVLEQIIPETSLDEENDKIEAVQLWAHHEQEGFFANNYDVWKNRKTTGKKDQDKLAP